MRTVIWGDWSGSYQTFPAAQRYIATQWKRSKYADKFWVGDTRQQEGVWQVRFGEVSYGEVSKEATSVQA